MGDALHLSSRTPSLIRISWPDRPAGFRETYERLYADRAYVTKETLEPVRRQVRELAAQYGLRDRRPRPITPAPEPVAEQLPLTAFIQAPGPPP